MIPTREESQALLDEVLALSRGAECRVVLRAASRAHLDFSASALTGEGRTEDREITIVGTAERRRAAVTSNSLDPASLARAVRDCFDLAGAASQDPDLGPEEGASPVTPVAAWFSDTAEAGPAVRADAARAAISAAKGVSGGAWGRVETAESLLAVATSRGFFACHRESLARFEALIRNGDGTGVGWEGREENRISALHPPDLSLAAAESARSAASLRGCDPGPLAVVLGPDAVAALIPFVVLSLDARLVEGGRSFFSRPGGRAALGEPVFGANVTLVSDPADTMLSSAPFSEEGIPRSRRVWIRGGVLRELSGSAVWSRSHGMQPAGGASTALLIGGAESPESLVAGASRGLLIRRLHYVNMVEMSRLSLSAVTRDGTFLVENGKVSRPVASLRVELSVPGILSSVEAFGVPRRVLGDPVMAMPALRAGRGVTVTGYAGA
ncbi:MAG: hypothetical protein HY049_14970 [Acidobacteria bacterium]|nr:hypothetical protein [Acidobacteriota bacterium]